VTIRSLQPSDIPILQAWAEKSGFPYPEPDDPAIEKTLVVVDHEGNPVVAIAGKRLVEILGWFNPNAGAALRNEAIAMVQAPMAEALRRLGYDCAEIFVPPQLERRGFGRILARLGCYRNLVSWGKRLM
jgi:hypothetical protein